MAIPVAEAKSEYLFFSAEISKLNRQLALAGIAVAWIFRGDSGAANIPGDLIPPLILFVASMLLDFIYYLLGVTHLNILLLGADRKTPPPASVNYPGRFGPRIYNSLYYLKFVPVGVGYVWILLYMTGRYF